MKQQFVLKTSNLPKLLQVFTIRTKDTSQKWLIICQNGIVLKTFIRMFEMCFRIEQGIFPQLVSHKMLTNSDSFSERKKNNQREEFSQRQMFSMEYFSLGVKAQQNGEQPNTGFCEDTCEARTKRLLEYQQCCRSITIENTREFHFIEEADLLSINFCSTCCSNKEDILTPHQNDKVTPCQLVIQVQTTC